MSNSCSETLPYFGTERLSSWWSVLSAWLGTGFLAILDQGLGLAALATSRLILFRLRRRRRFQSAIPARV
jgi:hypothetical protein